MPLGINKTNFMTPQQNSKINNEHLKPQLSSIYKNSKSAIKQINQNFSNLASKIKDGIESAKYKVTGSNMDALYNIKDSNISIKQNKKLENLKEIKTAFFKRFGENYGPTSINRFNTIAKNVSNQSKNELSKNDLLEFQTDLIGIKNDITPQSYSEITKSLNKLLADFDK
jgi:hypothetical protein